MTDGKKESSEYPTTDPEDLEFDGLSVSPIESQPALDLLSLVASLCLDVFRRYPQMVR